MQALPAPRGGWAEANAQRSTIAQTATPTDLAAAQTLTLRRLFSADWTSAVLALISVLVVVGVFHPNFLAPGQLVNVLQSSVYAALIAMGLVFLIPQNEIDLSVGGNYVLTGIVAALLMRVGYAAASGHSFWRCQCRC